MFVCVGMHTRMRQCQRQGVGHCCLGPKQAPVSPSSTRGDRQGAQRRRRVDGGERKTKGGEEKRERGRERKRTIGGEGLDSCLLPSLEASSSQS